MKTIYFMMVSFKSIEGSRCKVNQIEPIHADFPGLTCSGGYLNEIC